MRLGVVVSPGILSGCVGHEQEAGKALYRRSGGGSFLSAWAGHSDFAGQSTVEASTAWRGLAIGQNLLLAPIRGLLVGGSSCYQFAL